MARAGAGGGEPPGRRRMPTATSTLPRTITDAVAALPMSGRIARTGRIATRYRRAPAPTAAVHREERRRVAGRGTAWTRAVFGDAAGGGPPPAPLSSLNPPRAPGSPPPGAA